MTSSKDKTEKAMSIHNAKVLWDMVIFKGKKKYIAVECLSDGEISYKRSDSILHGIWECSSCRKIEYIRSINEQKLPVKIIDMETSDVKLQCKKCGSFIVVEGSKLNHFSCRNCRILSYSSVLEGNNCKFLDIYTEQDKFKTSYIRYENAQGEIRRVRSSHLMIGAWAPSDNGDLYNCNTSLYSFSFEKKTNDFQNPCGFYVKIGISKNPKTRLNHLNLIEKADLRILKEFNSRQDAIIFEKRLHRSLQNFSLDKHKAKLLSKRKRKTRKDPYMKDGYTEWFYCEDRETLEKEILNGLQL